MSCRECQINPVFVNFTNIPLCKKCFVRYFERKVLKTIRKYELFAPGSKVLVAFSVGKDSAVLLYFLSKYKERLRISLSAVLVDEGIKGYRDRVVGMGESFCKKLGISLRVVSYRDFYGVTLDGIMRRVARKGLNLSPCAVCGTLRRSLINDVAKEMGVDVVVTGHNEDDEAQNFILNVFKNNVGVFERLGVKTFDSDFFVRRVKPFYFMRENEIRLYAEIKELDFDSRICPYSKSSFRRDVKNMLDRFDSSYKGVVNGIVSFGMKIQKRVEGDKSKKVEKGCMTCGRGAQDEVCAVCKLRKLLEF